MSDLREIHSLACRKCGQAEDLDIVITTLARVTAEGSEPNGDHEWNDESFCRCPSCGTEGAVAAFTVKTRRRR